MGFKHAGHSVWRIAAMTIGGILFAFVMAFLFGWFVQLLWNWLMPAIFHLGTISYWQGFGLVLLAKIFLGGHPPHPHGFRGHGKQGHHGKKGCGTQHPSFDEHDTWMPMGSHKNWRYYGDYWKVEGKAHFEEFLKKKNGENLPGA